MKSLLRNFLIHLMTIWFVTVILPGFSYEGGIKTLVLAAAGLMLINIMVVPLLKIMFLPLNLLTLGLFTWVINVVGLYMLVTIVPAVKLMPYSFPGANIDGIVIPSADLNTLMVAILASFLVGFTSHFLQWLSK